MEIKRDLIYGQEDEKQRFDWYRPENPNGAGIICIHGDGWWQGDKQKEEKAAQAFVE